MTDIVEQAARVACPNGPDHDHQPNLDQGCNWALQLCQALADAGLLAEPARTLPTREQVETSVGAVLFDSTNHPDPVAVLGKSTEPLRDKVTDAVLTLLAEQSTIAEVKAQALEEAAAALREVPDSDPANLWMNNDSADWLQARAQQVRKETK